MQSRTSNLEEEKDNVCLIYHVSNWQITSAHKNEKEVNLYPLSFPAQWNAFKACICILDHGSLILLKAAVY